MIEKIKVLHVSSAHTRYDSRIFDKQLKTLADNPMYDVELLVNDGLENEINAKVSIRSWMRFKPRQRYRICFTNWMLPFVIVSRRPKVVHFHDPELIPVLMPLRLLGIKLIYDVHEDYTSRLMQREKMSFRLVGHVVKLFEKMCDRYCDGIVSVTDKISRKFKNINSVVVKNYPNFKIDNLSKTLVRQDEVCRFVYVGGITETRGFFEMISIFENLVNEYKISFDLAGPVNDQLISNEIQRMEEQYKNSFRYHGVLRKDNVEILLRNSDCGFILLHPTDAYKHSLPIKLFEYMSFGVFVIASNFEGYAQIIEDADCGLCVDPLDHKKLRSQVTTILDNLPAVRKKGEKGISKVVNEYAWNSQSAVLLQLYKKILLK